MICLTAGIKSLWAQSDSSTIYGVLLDPNGEALPDFPIILDNKARVYTSENGEWEFRVPARTNHELKVDYFGTVYRRKIKSAKDGQRLKVNFNITFETLDPTSKRVIKRDPPSIVIIKPKDVVEFPQIQIEDALSKIGLGIRKRSELSSSYNVRGGNFDENLIYINDIEVYRPFLARSGQQEGLSFINPYMTNNVSFSSGGFAARYGDKLSSVLDVQYNTPRDFSGSVELSLLGASIHVQDQPDTLGRFTYVLGARYRTLQYLLGTLDVSGDYRPRFTDFQGLFGYRLNSAWTVNWFSTYARNQYIVEPQSRETNFGTVQQAVRLFVAFAGAERIEYETFMNALSFEYKPNDSTMVKWITSSFNSEELEHFTIEGGYRLEELENNLGSDNFAEARAVLGIGYFINNARNDLNINVANTKVLTRLRRGKHEWELGAKLQTENIDDNLKEWNYNDSSGYRINFPLYPPTEIRLDDYIRTSNTLSSIRYMGYIQDDIRLHQPSNAKLSLGVRANYWNLNDQLLISPRGRFSFEPHKKYNDAVQQQKLEAYGNLDLKGASDSTIDAEYLKVSEKYDSLKKVDVVIKAAVGAYGQPPFYRELRNALGELNTNLQAQQSYHFVVGSDILFKAWNRPFRFINELYYKHMTNLVPYTINNVKLRYDAVNSSRGYAYGVDARVNGEFISGIESWVNLSLLSTKENITYTNENGEEVETGFIKRPTDQRVNFSILFQDELPLDTTFKMQLNLVIGSKMPYYFNGPFRYNETYTLPAYRRVDLGFSKQVKKFTKADENGGRLSSLWMSLEVFNILQVNNVASYLWVRDLNNNLYGVPNYLTGRRLNFKVIARF
jgi:hypothetical protein